MIEKDGLLNNRFFFLFPVFVYVCVYTVYVFMFVRGEGPTHLEDH